MTETTEQRVGVRVDSGTCSFETEQAVGRGEIQGALGGHLPRHAGPEGVAPRFLSTGGETLRRNEARVATPRERIKGGQCQLWRRLVESVGDKILTLERVVEAGLPLIQFASKRNAAAQPVRAAVDVESHGRSDARNKIPLASLVVEKDVVVVLLGHANRRGQRHPPALGRRRQKSQQLERIGRGRRAGAWGCWRGPRLRWLFARSPRSRFLTPRVGGDQTDGKPDSHASAYANSPSPRKH